ncbi:hypothetical protein SAMN05216474_2186 [Lishizhenia tianjinensis]|uniref:Uncharacterized protein n=1 Tax=Lishizhenia tianjinensis TaxID=477690 RepID=A0A1I7AKU5_9FLAO|nr:hypothetical protein [Lishizhenia tianjinensis]SFT75538.1 hypothetical protein SAMN05216474_2186 [Lishizhenia tianjinensis]
MKYLLLLILGLGILNESDTTPKYESIALQYYLDAIENKDVFLSSCDCKQEYYTKKTLKVYDATVSEVEEKLFFKDYKSEDFSVDTTRGIVLENLPKRVKLTHKLNHYRSWHYYLKFGHRKYLKDQVLISFSLKHYEHCSPQIFSFLMNSKGEILETDQTIWCDEN